jgi:hypothetical protein
VSEERKFSRIMRVANIRELKGRDYIEVMFLESARFYRLSKKNRAFDEMILLLRQAMAERRPVTVRLASIDSDTIEDVQLSD